MSRYKKLPRRLLCVAALMLFSLPGLAVPDIAAYDSPPNLLDDGQIVQALRSGGYVVYFRHGLTNTSIPDRDHVNLANCKAQRPLSYEGRQQMRAIGVAIKALDIHISTVLSSPYCRSIDTAMLAFGSAEIADDLRQGYEADEAVAERRTQALRQMLATPPSVPGTNTVISGHSSNLQAATGIWLRQEGAAVVFKPELDGTFTYIATISPTHWQELVRREQKLFGW